jgi:hypothetical protein
MRTGSHSRGILCLCASAGLLLVACNDPNEGGTAVSAVESDLQTCERPEVICHIPGKDRMKATEILVAPAAVEAHLRHGDSRGRCPFCTRRRDGISCNDGNLCTHDDRCESGTCVGGAVECAAPGPCQAASCDSATGACTLTNVPDGTGCDDGVVCTVGDQCLNGMCAGTTPGKVVGPSTTTVTCPAEATAVDGIVTPTCAFPVSFASNNIFTGPVSLISHLDRDFANFDVNATPIGDGTIQVDCVYRNADGLQIGGITTFVAATSCTATADAFICAH